MLNQFRKAGLRNAQYLDVMQQMADRFAAIKSITHRDWTPAVAALTTAVQKLDQDFKQQQGSDITAQITEADQKRDKAYQTFAAIIKAQAEAEVPAAQKVLKIINKYNLRTTMQMDEENAIIKQIHDDINDLGYEKLFDLGVTDHWALAISTTHVLSEYLRQRDDERATLQTGLIKADRAAIDSAYDRCATIIDAALIYEPSQALTDAVAKANSYINRVRTQMLSQSATESEEVSGATTTTIPEEPTEGSTEGNGNTPSTEGTQTPTPPSQGEDGGFGV